MHFETATTKPLLNTLQCTQNKLYMMTVSRGKFECSWHNFRSQTMASLSFEFFNLWLPRAWQEQRVNNFNSSITMLHRQLLAWHADFLKNTKERLSFLVGLLSSKCGLRQSRVLWQFIKRVENSKMTNHLIVAKTSDLLVSLTVSLQAESGDRKSHYNTSSGKHEGLSKVSSNPSICQRDISLDKCTYWLITALPLGFISQEP